MTYAIKQGDGWVAIDGAFYSGAGDDLVNHPEGWLEATSDEERAAIGVKEIVDDELPGANRRITGVRLVDRGGVPVQVYDTEQVPADELAAMARAAIDAERDRRIVAGFTFAGHLFQSRPEDQKRISGAFSLALAAVIGGAKPGDLRWHQPADGSPFEFIAADNTLVPMDAQTMLAFGRVAAGWESGHIFAARVLKNAVPPPADFANDRHWPA